MTKLIRKRLSAEFEKAWDESKHPRHPAGSAQGGEFTAAQAQDAVNTQEVNDELSRKPINWTDARPARVSEAMVAALPVYQAKDTMNQAHSLRIFDFKSKPKENAFVLERGGQRYLVDTQGYDYPRYVGRLPRKARAKGPEGNFMFLGDEPSKAKKEAGVEKFFKAEGVDDNLGLVFGWAIVCKEDGADYWDVQEDHIPEASMLKSAAEFMSGSRMMKEMHAGESMGTVLFAFPLTTDVAKAMGLGTTRTGLMIAVKPDNPAVLEKFKDGTYTGFSIGGTREEDETVTEKRDPRAQLRVIFGKAWDESKHPRHDAGNDKGGEFAPGQGGGGGESLAEGVSRINARIKGKGQVKDTGRKFVLSVPWDSDLNDFEADTLAGMENYINRKLGEAHSARVKKFREVFDKAWDASKR